MLKNRPHPPGQSASGSLALLYYFLLILNMIAHIFATNINVTMLQMILNIVSSMVFLPIKTEMAAGNKSKQKK